jgi:hypothetical protein
LIAGSVIALVATVIATGGRPPGFGSTPQVADVDPDEVQFQVDPEYLVPVPRNTSNPVWTDSGIVVSVQRENDSQLALARPGRPRDPVQLLRLPAKSRDCHWFRYYAPVAAPGGVDAVQECLMRGPIETFRRLVHVDIATETVRPLFASGWHDRLIRTFTVSANRQYAIAEEGSVICNSLLRISDAGFSRPVVRPANLIPDQGLPVPINGERPDGCDGQGAAYAAALSASGDLAFWASPAAAESSGMSRLFADSGVYLRPAGQTEARLLLEGDLDAVSLVWHPSEPVLAMGDRQGGVGGIWLVDPETGVRSPVTGSGWAGPVTWNPAGTKLIGIMRGMSEGKIRKWLVTYKVCGDLPGISAAPESPLADYPCRR